MKSGMFLKKFINLLHYLGAFAVGAFTLSFFSVFQKSALGIKNFPLQLKAFVVPIVFGGFAGLIIAFFYIRLQNKSREMEEYLDHIDNLVQIVSAKKGFIYVNQTWLDTLKYSRAEVRKLHVTDILHPERRDKCMAMMERMLAGEDVGEIESIFVAKDGSEIYVRGTSNGDASKMRGIFKNITDEREAQEFERLSRQVFTHTKEGLLITDKAMKIILSNAAFTKLCGYQESELVGKNMQAYFSFSEHTPTTFAAIKKALDKNLRWQGELFVRKKKRGTFPARISISVIIARNGEISHYFSLIDDISKDKKNEKALKKMALYDPLTELPNRHHFHELLEEAIMKGKNFAVFFLDLDGFKNINDQYGHAKGDQLLQAVARRLKSSLREVDAVARLGGDEFGALVKKTNDPAKVRKIAEKLAKKINTPYNLNGDTVHITASIGVSFFPHSQTLDDLLNIADHAMYHAKNTAGIQVMLAGEEPLPRP